MQSDLLELPRELRLSCPQINRRLRRIAIRVNIPGTYSWQLVLLRLEPNFFNLAKLINVLAARAKLRPESRAAELGGKLISLGAQIG